jgi:DNA polymerase III gamma/tau subunit
VRVVIIDEVHALSKQAVTALLKSLEDPPKYVYWFLCTTDPSKLPAAIKTRCLAYQLKEVRVKELVKLLDSTEEGHELDEDILQLCAEEAGGSPRQALSNLGVCLTAKTVEQATRLLHSAEKSKEAIDLARLLLSGSDWSSVCALLSKMKELNPESVRHTVRAYMTSVILSPKGGNPTKAFAVLEEFSTPFNSFDGMSPLVLACGRLLLGSD